MGQEKNRTYITANQKSMRTLGEKENCKYVGILATKRDEMQNKKKVYSEEQEDLSNPSSAAEPHQRDKYRSCFPSKILGTILKMDKGGSRTNRLSEQRC